jgi:salicylate hydroxylase
MLPFTGQGAAQAIEDGATLAACLIKFGTRNIAETLRRYEAFRLPRASHLQAMSAANKERFHLPDGPEQQRRDSDMADVGADTSVSLIKSIYSHDAAALTEKSH